MSLNEPVMSKNFGRRIEDIIVVTQKLDKENETISTQETLEKPQAQSINNVKQNIL